MCLYLVTPQPPVLMVPSCVLVAPGRVQQPRRSRGNWAALGWGSPCGRGLGKVSLLPVWICGLRGSLLVGCGQRSSRVPALSRLCGVCAGSHGHLHFLSRGKQWWRCEVLVVQLGHSQPDFAEAVRIFQVLLFLHEFHELVMVCLKVTQWDDWPPFLVTGRRE